MSLAGSCFSTDSAHRPFHHGIRRRGGTIADGDDAATLANESISVSWLNAVNAAFQDAAIQGVTICIASGDTGANSNVGANPGAWGLPFAGDGKAHVQYPGSDPWVLAVGGTTIGNRRAGSRESGDRDVLGRLTKGIEPDVRRVNADVGNDGRVAAKDGTDVGRLISVKRQEKARATPEQLKAMSWAERLDYCRRFDQRPGKQPAWVDPRLRGG